MVHRQLGQTGLTVSSLGLGCVTFGREIDRDTSFAILDHAVQRGMTLFDTAEAYGSGASESILGDWLAERGIRDEIVLASKVSGNLTADRIRDSAEASLRRLKTDRIDLFQLHNWDDRIPLAETLDALRRLVETGKVRYSGCSNWQAWQLAKALLSVHERGAIRLESVQPPYNLVQREIEPDLLPLCVDQQIGVIAYSPLGAGFLTGKYRRGAEVPLGTRFEVIPGHQPIYFTDRGFRIVEELRQTADAMGTSMIQLALSWVLGNPLITTVLIGARHPGHVDQAFAADASPLTEEVREELNRLSE